MSRTSAFPQATISDGSSFLRSQPRADYSRTAAGEVDVTVSEKIAVCWSAPETGVTVLRKIFLRVSIMTADMGLVPGYEET